MSDQSGNEAVPITLEQLQQVGRAMQSFLTAINNLFAPLSSICSGGPVGSLNIKPFAGTVPFYTDKCFEQLPAYMAVPPEVAKVMKANLERKYGKGAQPPRERLEPDRPRMTITYPTTTTITLTPDELRTMIREEVQAALQELEDTPTPALLTLSGEQAQQTDDALSA